MKLSSDPLSQGTESPKQNDIWAAMANVSCDTIEARMLREIGLAADVPPRIPLQC